MMIVDFLPSQVFIRPGSPLVATMGRAELEHAAALIVRTCHFHGDKWQAVGPKTVGETLLADETAERSPFGGLGGFASNRFFLPDFDGLVAGGFARWTDLEKGRGSPIEFSSKGLEAIRKWVRTSK